jgi:PhoH-like ATPase
MDLWILQSALNEQANYEEVLLVSKDLNLRLLAEGEGLVAEDYETNKVLVSEVYKGFRDLGEIPYSAELYIPDVEIEADEWVEEPLENEFYISQTDGKQFLSRNEAGVLVPVDKEFSTSIQPRNIEQRMALDILLDPSIKLICLVGKAGTGKTILALAGALAQLHNPYDKIMLSKPIIDMGNSIGFLPGELDDKLAPWMESYFDNLSQLIPSKTKIQVGGKYSTSKDVPHWRYLLDTGSIVMQPINSIRGRSISDAYMIIDEAQNLTPHEVKTLITRAAEGTKVILMGDPFQVDSPFLDQNSNGLTYVCEKMKGSRIFGAVFFSQGVRSELAEEAATRL